MEKPSLTRRDPSRESSTAAVARRAVIRDDTSRQTLRLLGAGQREYDRRRPSAAMTHISHPNSGVDRLKAVTQLPIALAAVHRREAGKRQRLFAHLASMLC